MHSIWFKGSKNKEARRKEVMGYRNSFDALREILERDFKKKENVREYSDPQWVHKQIAVNEYNQALEDLLKIINLEKE